jgi:hypothetical protein
MPPYTHIRARLLPVRASGVRCAAAALLAVVAARGADEAPRVTVQALPRFEELSCRQTDAGLELRARLLDDVGNPLGEVPITVEALERGAALQAQPCAAAARGRASAPRTDAVGRVCILVSGSLSGSLTLRFRGDALHLPAQAELPLEPAAGELRLAFDSPALELNLDQPEQRLTLQLSGDVAASVALPPVTVQLEEAGKLRPIETRDWSRSGDALQFSIESAALGMPGPARLLARAAGAEHPSAPAEAVALRSASVELSREAVDSERDVLELRIRAHSRAGVPSGGWVDASSGGQALASSPLTNGVANLQLALPVPAASVLVRYHSDDPWWLPGAALSIDLETPAPAEPARWPWLVLLAPVGYVCVRALERPGVRKPRRSARRATPQPSAAALRAVPPAPASGWAGNVTDAHDGRAIAGAHVQAALPSLRDQPLGVSTLTDAAGYFVLPALPEPIPEGAQLLVLAPLHSDFQRALPPQGRVDVTLTSRRRALLGRLVRWAKAAGPPWHRSAEPTPGEVLDVALRRGDPKAARWAEGIQEAAFSLGDVDAQREAALHEQEPAWQQQAGTRPEPPGAD